MGKRTRVTLSIFVVVVVIAVFAATAVKRLHNDEVESIESVQQAEGIPVDYVVTRAFPIGHWRGFVGVAEGYDQVDLIADFRTRVEAVHAEVGDEILKGKVIVSLDEFDPARIMVNLGTARIQYLTARRDSLRMEELFKSGAISQQQLDYARAESERALASYNTARRAVELDSPIAGVVTALYVEGGDIAEAGQVLATIASYRKMKIHLDVSTTERAVLEVGQKVRVPAGDESRRAPGSAPEQTWLSGIVKDVSLSADPESRLFRVDLVIENADRLLKPGALVSPEILVAVSTEAPAVPSASILRQGDRDIVYVISGDDDDRRAELRTVTPGISNGVLSAITRGIETGDQVVVWGQGKLRDGLKVKLHEDLTAKFFEVRDHLGGTK